MSDKRNMWIRDGITILPVFNWISLRSDFDRICRENNREMMLKTSEDKDARAYAFAAYESNVLVGFVNGSSRQNSGGTINNLFVMPTAQGKKIGSMLLNRAEKYLTTVGSGVTLKSDPKSCEFFKKCGYVGNGQDYTYNFSKNLLDAPKKNFVTLVMGFMQRVCMRDVYSVLKRESFYTVLGNKVPAFALWNEFGRISGFLYYDADTEKKVIMVNEEKLGQQCAQEVKAHLTFAYNDYILAKAGKSK